ncbi:hypothetical protein LOZ53_000631 [Ophidiomyces ophidiicola]|uniref:Uncharacterized protein n=1 Tax=Ophidiomyces ophidiicola TaxID=1387563 RepID=A0ACB8V3V5_9EURO|nr:uncharacterized protein LOZ57_005117 [Ophidiomyces ophidiicola]KAI1915021.1 hypothetical protein LOZ61_001945 [Ophidiomyces ophidiicola]KAI1923298.1 hypothetical protein LOZ64_000973 [Ophidiomyces ophidiicola]KAI1930127.1 hypothetical protein LOZ60_001186 [Ophidiomyces ophidiicola]KAI1943170.1 hypothetical protein LOZ57_005117 [Ophidiomyces ophidiicola]KAI1965109.1 hypothetical protein LOZ59_001435 [Ophidiomyces ophidiicola]
MGNKVSTVNGLRSPNILQPGNAVNEVWVGNLEIISRLPFGDSNLAQAGWPKGDYPKIPWHPFIIPLRARADKIARSISVTALERRGISEMMAKVDWLLMFWTLERIVAIPFFLSTIAFHLTPDRFDASGFMGPCVYGCEDGELGHTPHLKYPIIIRAKMACLFYATGLFVLFLQNIISATTSHFNMPTISRFELVFYSCLGILASYSCLRLMLAAFQATNQLVGETEMRFKESRDITFTE